MDKCGLDVFRLKGAQAALEILASYPFCKSPHPPRGACICPLQNPFRPC